MARLPRGLTPYECLATREPTILDDKFHAMTWKILYGCRDGQEPFPPLDRQVAAALRTNQHNPRPQRHAWHGAAPPDPVCNVRRSSSDRTTGSART
jgi:hypothetical protein